MGETLILLEECVRNQTKYMDAFNDAIDTTEWRSWVELEVDSLGQIIRLPQPWGSLIEF
jgi:hypothetical protein